MNIDILKLNNKKKFKVRGWYSLQSNRNFEDLYLICNDKEKAIALFKEHYKATIFDKINVKEIL